MIPFKHSEGTRIKQWSCARIRGLTATGFSLVFLAGCGGTSDKQTTGVGDEFASKAVAVCAAALAEKHDWQPFPVADFDPADPDASKFPEVSIWLAEQVAPDLPHVGERPASARGTAGRAGGLERRARRSQEDRPAEQRSDHRGEQTRCRGVRGCDFGSRLDPGRTGRRYRQGRRSRLRRRACRIAPTRRARLTCVGPSRRRRASLCSGEARRVRQGYVTLALLRAGSLCAFHPPLTRPLVHVPAIDRPDAETEPE